MLTIWDEFGGSGAIYHDDLARERDQQERDTLLTGYRIAELEARLAAIESGEPKPIVTKAPKPRPVINGVLMGKSRVDDNDALDEVLAGLPEAIKQRYLRSK